MATKSLVFCSLFVAMIALPIANAQLGGLGGLVGPLLGLFRIQGILYCTPDGNIGVNGTSTPVFPNALVQLRCGRNVVAIATSNENGLFSIFLGQTNMVLSTLLSGCQLFVTTPLEYCNASFPSIGDLVSNLQFIGSPLLVELQIGNLIPSGFLFNANMN